MRWTDKGKWGIAYPTQQGKQERDARHKYSVELITTGNYTLTRGDPLTRNLDLLSSARYVASDAFQLYTRYWLRTPCFERFKLETRHYFI